MYKPKPIDTSAVELPWEIASILERLAENAHDVWAARRLADGWTFGERIDEARKTHPMIVPYADLPEVDKDRDRAAALSTLKAITALGFRIVPPNAARR